MLLLLRIIHPQDAILLQRLKTHWLNEPSNHENMPIKDMHASPFKRFQVWAVPVSLATTPGIRQLTTNNLQPTTQKCCGLAVVSRKLSYGVFFSSGYWDVSLPQVTFNPPMNSADDNPAFRGIGLPHSEIPGSKVACHLTEAYRRLLRPSSSFHTKASTICT